MGGNKEEQAPHIPDSPGEEEASQPAAPAAPPAQSPQQPKYPPHEAGLGVSGWQNGMPDQQGRAAVMHGSQAGEYGAQPLMQDGFAAPSLYVQQPPPPPPAQPMYYAPPPPPQPMNFAPPPPPMQAGPPPAGYGQPQGPPMGFAPQPAPMGFSPQQGYGPPQGPPMNYAPHSPPMQAQGPPTSYAQAPPPPQVYAYPPPPQAGYGQGPPSSYGPPQPQQFGYVQGPAPNYGYPQYQQPGSAAPSHAEHPSSSDQDAQWLYDVLSERDREDVVGSYAEHRPQHSRSQAPPREHHARVGSPPKPHHSRARSPPPLAYYSTRNFRSTPSAPSSSQHRSTRFPYDPPRNAPPAPPADNSGIDPVFMQWYDVIMYADPKKMDSRSYEELCSLEKPLVAYLKGVGGERAARYANAIMDKFDGWEDEDLGGRAGEKKKRKGEK